MSYDMPKLTREQVIQTIEKLQQGMGIAERCLLEDIKRAYLELDNKLNE